MTQADVHTLPDSRRAGSQSSEPAPDPQRLLRLYLRDHDAASAGGLQLLRRSCASNVDTQFGPVLADLLQQVEQDAAALQGITERLDVSHDPVKRAVAWVGVTLGGLKLNSRLVSYSPLSRVYEIEGLMAGVRAKSALWTTLQQVVKTDARIDADELKRLKSRADEQLRTLDDLHGRAVALAFDTKN